MCTSLCNNNDGDRTNINNKNIFSRQQTCRVLHFCMYERSNIEKYRHTLLNEIIIYTQNSYENIFYTNYWMHLTTILQ